MTFAVIVSDIQDIRNPKEIDEFLISADSKACAQDKAHDEAFKLHPNVQRLVQIQQTFDH